MKSISKSYGVPGLRLGILASSNIQLIDFIKKDVSIWNINSFAEYYMQIYGKYASDYDKACEAFIRERKRFFDRLSSIPILRVIPSQANYFLCEVKDGYTARELTITLLKRYGIFIKDCTTKTGLRDKEYVRIAIRDSKDNDQLVAALSEISNG